MTPPLPQTSDEAAAYAVIPARGDAGPFVFASPHSGVLRPSDMRPNPVLSEASLRSAEDVLVDQLAAAGPERGAPLILGRVSRAYVDLNRDPAELDPGLIEGLEPRELSPKTAAGFGVIPRRAGDGQPLNAGPLSRVEAEARLTWVHAPYHAALANLMQAAHDRHGAAVLVDWHSMPSRAAGGRPAGASGRAVRGVDVVLGDRYGSSCGVILTRRLRALFEGLGWRVGLNQPYAGGYSTQIWGRPSQGFHAIQIEINRALYLNEQTLEPSADFRRTQAALSRVITTFCDQGLPDGETA